MRASFRTGGPPIQYGKQFSRIQTDEIGSAARDAKRVRKLRKRKMKSAGSRRLVPGQSGTSLVIAQQTGAAL